jgi:D-alanine-D-alanine ligase
MNVCVLQPDYATTTVDYKNYDPPRNLSPLLPGHTVDHVFLNKLTVYKQLRELSKNPYDIYVNLCEGYLEWEVPSIDVIWYLDLLRLPYTGPNAAVYDPSKELMKYVAYTAGVPTPAFALIHAPDEIAAACRHLRYPLFVKPSKAGDSLGINDHSVVHNEAALIEQVVHILDEYGPILVEEYIEGREFTVMLVADADDPKKSTVFKPIEYIFPAGKSFKTYALKTAELHPEANIPVSDPAIESRLKTAAASIFAGFGGVGYARLDFRMNADGELFFLEINFTCSVFYTAGYEGSADYILACDGTGQAGFLEKIIAEGMARFQRQVKPYEMKGNAIAGYGIYARRTIPAGDVVFKGEEKAQRLVTRRYAEKHYTGNDMMNFKRYAYPVSREVFLLWDENPSEWAPQNHSCNPNTAYDGLNVVAIRSIAAGEELTLDYASFLNEHMQPFPCCCGSTNCRGLIQGTPGLTMGNTSLQQ